MSRTLFGLVRFVGFVHQPLINHKRLVRRIRCHHSVAATRPFAPVPLQDRHRCFAIPPVCHPEFHLSDVMTTIGVVFVRHETRIKLIAILSDYRQPVQKLFMHQSHVTDQILC